ncbi:hypothetical protein D9757_009425 [Collybiopsis confluens]|uniref:F-box domain-containing protein n=1 Tax=Collybiopsis confluens TaxID=2823264 RepID=A0A8H5M525_9AGAR|nr:hypothetical protein D9757_009425 [Collybiopsis confluens]
MDKIDIHRYSRLPRGIPEQYVCDIQESLRFLDEELDGCNDEISRLERRILSLKNRREAVKKQTMDLQALLSPIRRIPNELLSQIFRLICDDNDTRYATERWGISTLPFQLGAVCFRWRSLCLADSRIWATLVINCGKERDIRVVELLDLFLERSKQQSLRLKMVCFQYQPSASLIRKLTGCSSRWKDLTLTLIDLSSLSSELRELPLPALEFLDIKTMEGGGDLGIFAHAPKLQTLAVIESLTLNSIVLGRITDLACYAGTRVQSALGMCSNLRTLDISSFGHGTSAHMGLTVIPTLTSLSATSAVPDDEVFRFVTAPALISLSLRQLCPDDPDSGTQPHIFRFLDRSHCSLTKLSVEVPWTDQELLALLRILPNLEELSVHTLKGSRLPLTITKHFLKGLHVPPRSSPSNAILPKLISLTLETSLAPFAHAMFKKMILSRWNLGHLSSTGVACIRFVNLGLPRLSPANEQEYADLFSLRKVGLCFDLHSTSTA